MQHKFIYNTSETDAGTSILQFLRQKGYSRHLLNAMKVFPESVLVNGEKRFLKTALQEGDEICVTLPPEDDYETAEPHNVPFSIVYEDADILVINKASGVPVHPSANHQTDTLANGVALYCREKGENFPFRCINRLDRDTTGLLIVAKHAFSAAVLYADMRERRIERTYFAIVEGDITEKGTIDLPIARKEGSVMERCIDFERGETAVTHYKPVKRGFLNGCSWTLLEIHLETGRTHQIRVHMQAVGHPLVGDTLYNPDGMSGMPRQALHSGTLAFHHPITGKFLQFTSDLPDDFLSFFAQNH